MNPYSRPERQQDGRPGFFLSSSAQADDRTNPWLLTRGIDRASDRALSSSSRQPWLEPYPSTSSFDSRYQPLGQSSGTYTSALHNPRPSNPYILEQTPLEGSSLQFPIGVPDIPIGNAGNQTFPSIAAMEVQGRKGKRMPYKKEEWEQHLPRIKHLYIEQDMTLGATMAKLAEEQNFAPSERAYKKKFTELGWVKKLPTSTAHFIVNKHREREEGRGVTTDFVLYDNPISIEKAEETMRRSKGGTIMPLQTPAGLTYYTPPGNPGNITAPEYSRNPLQRSWTPLTDAHTPFPSYLPLVWRGNRLDDFTAMFREASECVEAGDLYTAERKYREALAGYERLLSPTHDETLELGYQVADFYARQSRMLQADEVLDWMNKKVVAQWGISHPKANAHFLRISNIYRSWSREGDARILISRLSEVLTKASSKMLTSSTESQALPSIQHLLAEGRAASNNNSQSESEDLKQLLKFAREQLAQDFPESSRAAIENVISGVIKRCENDLSSWSLEILNAACLLIELAQHAERIEEFDSLQVKAATAGAHAVQFRRNNAEEVLKAAIELLQLFEECKEASPALTRQIAEMITTRAEQDFGEDKEGTIAVLILIGSVYQAKRDWKKARPWFEHAMSISIARFCPLNECAKALDDALAEGMFKDYEYYSNMLFEQQKDSRLAY